jgi:hypothetical protein
MGVLGVITEVVLQLHDEGKVLAWAPFHMRKDTDLADEILKTLEVSLGLLSSVAQIHQRFGLFCRQRKSRQCKSRQCKRLPVECKARV